MTLALFGLAAANILLLLVMARRFFQLFSRLDARSAGLEAEAAQQRAQADTLRMLQEQAIEAMKSAFRLHQETQAHMQLHLDRFHRDG